MRRNLVALFTVVAASMAVARAAAHDPASPEPVAAPTAASGPSHTEDPPAPAAPEGPATAAADPEQDARRARLLARVAERVLTVGDFEDQLSSPSVPLPVRASFNRPERVRHEFDERVQRMVLAEWAVRQGYDRRPDVLREIRKVYRGAVLHRHVHQALDESVITDEEVRAYYESHRDSYNRPETVNAGMILLGSRPAAEAALQRALAVKGNRAELTRLARELSIDNETKHRGGSLGSFDRDGKRRRIVAEGQPEPPRVDPAIVAAAFTLTTPLDVYPQVVESAAGPAVVFLLSRSAAVNRTVEEVAPRIRRDLLAKRREALRQQFVSDARVRLRVRVFDAAFEHVVVAPGEPEPGPPPVDSPLGTTPLPTPVLPHSKPVR